MSKIPGLPDLHGRRFNYFDSLYKEPLNLNELGQGSPFNTMPSPYPDQLRSCFPSSSPSSQMGPFEYKSIDWKETPHAHVFKADVPGMRKEEVNVEVEDDRFLQISGERKMEIDDRGDTWHQIERSSGKFMRRMRLPANANVGQVKASMENGVLTVTVLKEVTKKRHVKQIEISSAWLALASYP